LVPFWKPPNNTDSTIKATTISRIHSSTRPLRVLGRRLFTPVFCPHSRKYAYLAQITGSSGALRRALRVAARAWRW
jgi:hypothetical protein